MKTRELQGAALDWVVGVIEQMDRFGPFDDADNVWRDEEDCWYKPSEDWSQAGPIIEREEISISREFCSGKIEWACWTPAPCRDDAEAFGYGPTPLIAAMRWYVAAKLGAEVEVPAELLEVPA